MAWVVTPPTQTQESKTGWVTSPTTTPTTPQRGWLGSGSITIMWGPRGNGQLDVTTMARPSKAAPLTGDGALSATVLKREYRTAALTGLGTLAGPYSQIHPSAPLFNSMGFLFGDTVSTHLEPQFSGDGALYGYWDGLTAVVNPATSCDVFFSGEGNLPTPLDIIYYLLAEFTGQGTLTGPLVPKLVANLAGNGALLASAYARYSRAVALLASGTLSATDIAQYLRSAGFTGAGALTNLLQILYTPAQGGTGTVSATTKQIYANAPALSGGGTLSAEAFGGMLPSLSGAGALSATRVPAYQRTASPAGSGALAGTAGERYFYYPALNSLGTITGATMQKYDLDYLGGVGVSDNFNRADNATTPGPGWGARLGVCGTQNNQFYPINEGWNGVSFDSYPMSTDDHEASVVWGDVVGDGSGDLTIVMIGCNGSGAGAAGYFTAGGIGYITKTDDWTMSSGAILVTAQYDDPKPFFFGAGDRIGIRRVGNVYFLTKNGQIHSDRGVYMDSPQVIPRGAAYRTVALYQYRTGANYRRLENFEARDVTSVPFTGGGTLSATVLPVVPVSTTLIDTITRANSTTDAGPEWLRRANTLGVINNAIRPVTASAWCQSSWVVMGGNDAEITITLGPYVGTPGGDYTWAMLGCNIAGEGVALHTNGSSFVIYSQDTWAMGGIVAQNSVAGTVATGDKFTLRRIDNVYYLLKNGAPTGAQWSDGAALIPINQAHRIVAVGCYGDGTNYRTIADVEVKNLNPTRAVLSGSGSLSATVIGFVPFSETNTARTNQAVPAGCGGCWVTLIGGGGGGGCGGTNQGSGGAGGGGAGKVGRSFIARASLGATYSVGIGTGGAKGLASNNSDGSAGTASTFSSGGVSWSAGGGGAGAKGGTGSSSTAGAGGTCSTTGVAGTINNGTAGGAGTGGAGSAGPNNATGSAAGGGAGGKGTVFGSNAGGKGGNSATITGGNGGNPGATPSNAAAGNGGGGGGGGNENGTGGAAGDAGNGGGYGGGGGGGGGTNNLASGAQGDGGTGAGAYTLVEWVGT